jgi:hypothetical protein
LIVEPERLTDLALSIVSSGTLPVSTRRRPIKVDFPSSTEPQVTSLMIGLSNIRAFQASFSGGAYICYIDKPSWHWRRAT